MLLSSGDLLSQARLAREPFRGLKLYKFLGPPDIGTDDWLQKLDRNPQKKFAWLRQDGLDLAESLLTDNVTIQTLRDAKFDLVLRDAVSWPSKLLSQILGIPEVDALTLGCLQPFFGPRYSIPNPLAYIPGLTSTAAPPTGFKQRFDNLLQYLLMRYVVMSDTSTSERKLSERFGYTAVGSWMSPSTAAAVFVSGDWALEWPFPIPPKVHNDILAHPATRAFVTHAGANSLYEAAYHAVPVVAIPFFGDQGRYAAQSVSHGFGVVLSTQQLEDTTNLHVHDAINRVIIDPSFQANATKVQRRLKKPRMPAQRAADVVEHALSTGGEDYMGTAENLYAWWQLAMLDVYLCILACLAAAVGLVIGFLCLTAQHGNLQAVQWLCQQSPTCRWDYISVTRAARGAPYQNELVQRIQSKDEPCL
ncbi:hypothetical protein WJX74_007115 [Apatococcus lobatus]|uniref:Uncharacterized protein n=1 Tax=Apatococcus lobatus TaxID=904363 RepID=A0AAW1RYE1_9CHLO